MEGEEEEERDRRGWLSTIRAEIREGDDRRAEDVKSCSWKGRWLNIFCSLEEMVVGSEGEATWLAPRFSTSYFLL